ncbi:hypothetical protein AAA122_18465, partial [Ruthenibacterium lactatiformans]|uniref:hypothetical protein n=1 Tax=Ruthenibacterium lactatiformans TaxID=1550024 RepID=UPI0032C0FAA7
QKRTDFSESFLTVRMTCERFLSKNLDFDLPASFGCESVTEKYSVPVLPLPPAESEQRKFYFQ